MPGLGDWQAKKARAEREVRILRESIGWRDGTGESGIGGCDGGTWAGPAIHACEDALDALLARAEDAEAREARLREALERVTQVAEAQRDGLLIRVELRNLIIDAARAALAAQPAAPEAAP